MICSHDKLFSIQVMLKMLLDTDASNEAIGAVLSQEIDGKERTIAFASRTLTKPERRYCVTRKE
jgi:hypothetical protein